MAESARTRLLLEEAIRDAASSVVRTAESDVEEDRFAELYLGDPVFIIIMRSSDTSDHSSASEVC